MDVQFIFNKFQYLLLSIAIFAIIQLMIEKDQYFIQMYL